MEIFGDKGDTMPDYDIGDCENDYDLVMRAGKELEWALRDDFGLNDTTRGLAAKIQRARGANAERLPPKLKKGMLKVARIRNQFAHNRTINSFVDSSARQEFVEDWREVHAELMIERSRAMTDKQCSFTKVLPRQPGDDFIRTEFRTGIVPAGLRRRRRGAASPREGVGAGGGHSNRRTGQLKHRRAAQQGPS